MNSLLPTIVPKSDQLNADDMIGGPMTIKVSKVSILGDADQPVAVHFEGDSGRPFKPCKSMRRVMVQVWGEDGNAFVGQRMTLYRDDRVTFGKDAVGGIRISHMSGLDREKTLALMVTRGQRKPYTVRPLPAGAGDAPTFNLPVLLADGRLAAANGSGSLAEWWTALGRAEKAAAKATLDAELKAMAAKADQAALDAPFDGDTGEIRGEADDDDFPGDRAAPEDDQSDSADGPPAFDAIGWAAEQHAKALTFEFEPALKKWWNSDPVQIGFEKLKAANPAMADTLLAQIKATGTALAGKV